MKIDHIIENLKKQIESADTEVSKKEKKIIIK